MPSHIYMRIGRYGDAVRANQRAYMADQLAALGKAAAIYPGHNLDMLAFAAWMDGQSFVALQAARELLRHHGHGGGNSHLLPLMMARFGRWEEILELPELASDLEDSERDFQEAMRHFATGLALLRLEQLSQAEVELEQLASRKAALLEAEGAAGEEEEEERNEKVRRGMVKIAHAMLAGELAHAKEDLQAALKWMREAIQIEDGLPYNEPEDWPLPARQFLGALLLEVGRSDEAERVYRDELLDHPENGWSLYGLLESLRAQGRDEEAESVRQRFERVWARADVVLVSSRY